VLCPEASQKAESFPFVVYNPRVPQLTTSQVRAVLRQLTVGERLPSGAVVRAALKRQFGSPGGVARIYRLLAEERVRLEPPRPHDESEDLRRELALMTERATRAEFREEAHQRRWAEEVDRLRRQVDAFEPLRKQAEIAVESCKLLRHQLQAAEMRASTFERRLWEIEEQQLSLGSSRGEESSIHPSNNGVPPKGS
jgi:hypothetical protein